MWNFHAVMSVITMVVVIFAAKLYKDNLEMRKQNPVTTNYAVRPDIFIESANRDIRRHYFKTSLKDIEKAIAAMRLIQRDMDEVSQQAIQTAISDLEILEGQLQEKVVDHDYIAQVFTYCLNSLAYAQMRVSESYCEKGEMKEAKYALKYAMEHLHNATRYSDEMERKIEQQVYITIDSLIDNKVTDQEFLQQSVQALLLEMDTTVMRVR